MVVENRRFPSVRVELFHWTYRLHIPSYVFFFYWRKTEREHSTQTVASKKKRTKQIHTNHIYIFFNRPPLMLMVSNSVFLCKAMALGWNERGDDPNPWHGTFKEFNRHDLVYAIYECVSKQKLFFYMKCEFGVIIFSFDSSTFLKFWRYRLMQPDNQTNATKCTNNVRLCFVYRTKKFHTKQILRNKSLQTNRNGSL